MSSSFQDSVILITSSDPSLQSKRAFGTGFVIHRTDEATYLLTCAHVVRDVGGVEKVLANGQAATVVASGESDGFDLAVLRVQDLWSKPVLQLSPSSVLAKPFAIAGYYAFDQKETRLLREIQGNLGKQTFIPSTDGRDRIKAWDLHIDDEDLLQPGYSGSPVVDRATGAVLAMVSHQVKQGQRGLAIAIEAVGKIWREMPVELCKENVFQTSEPGLLTEAMEVFISYSPKDEKLLIELEDSLSVLEEVKIWHKGKIRAGQNPKVESEKHLNLARIILLLISPHFISSINSNNQRNSEIQFEAKLAIEREKAGATVIPVLLKSANWDRVRFGGKLLGDFKPLPRNGKFVTGKGWKNQSEAFFTIGAEFAEEVERLAAE